MRLQFCDSCGRPLSEGAIARGEAVERDGETICSHCIAREPMRAPAETGPLGEYQSAVWRCESCGIPVTALDLIEGRATRVGGGLSCSRCTAPAASRREPRSVPRAPALSSVRSRPGQPVRKAASEFVAGADSDRRRPVLPVVVFVIVLPMFAVSLWFAITSQHRLNQLNSERANVPAQAKAQQPERPAPQPVTNPPPNEPPVPEPEPPREAPPPTIPADVANELVEVERGLAAPVIDKLRSEDLADVWEGLIEAGSMRLIAARPTVRALLGDRDDETRLLACRVSAILDDKEALPILARMADVDPSADVKLEARKARDRLSGRSSREMRDMTDAEIETLIKELRAELDRRGPRDD